MNRKKTLENIEVTIKNRQSSYKGNIGWTTKNEVKLHRNLKKKSTVTGGGQRQNINHSNCVKEKYSQKDYIYQSELKPLGRRV